MQEKKLNQLIQKVENVMMKTVRKGDIVTRWEENKYVVLAVDNGYEKSTITERLSKNVRTELEDDVVSITFLFGAATYPLEGRLLEELLNKAQNQLYKERDSK